MSGHIQKKGNNYYIVIEQGYDNDGKRLPAKWISVRKELGLNRPAKSPEAKALLYRLMVEKQKGDIIIPADISLEEFLTTWLEKYSKMKSLAKSTIIQYEFALKHIIPVMGRTKLPNVTGLMIQNFLTEKRKHYSANSVHAICKVFTLGFKYAVKWRYIAKNPMDDVVKPTVPRPAIHFWTEEEAEKFLSAVEDHQYSLLFLLALATGMRKMEILRLKRKYVNFNNNTITVTDAKTASGWRTIDVTPVIMKKLEQYKSKSNDEYIFTTAKGKPLIPQLINKIMDRAIKKAGVKKISFHGLRHTFATLMLSKGVNPVDVADMLGHANASQLWNTYAHVIGKNRKEAARKLDNLFENFGEKTE